jgi:succinoglycan biosynthesis protein ExoL
MRDSKYLTDLQSIDKIIFISPTSSQPRFHKRAAQLATIFDVMVFAFSRGYYEENTFPSEIAVTPLGRINDKKYLRRVFSIIPAVLKIRNHLKKKRNYLFYAFSFDCLIIAKLCGLKHGYYEVGDLREDRSDVKISFFEKLILKNILGVVLTSRYFYYDFFRNKNIVPRDKIYIIDNKVNRDLVDQRPLDKRISQGRIVIGLFGLLRFRRPIELLLQFVKERPESYIIECSGDGWLRGFVESNMCENIRYHGSFRNPEELANIYANVDLNYVVYDYSPNNVLAIPNKLFESAFFGVPIVCCQETSVGKMAINWKIGKMVRIDTRKNFEDDLGSIDRKSLQIWSKNCLKIPNSELLDNGTKILRDMIIEDGKGENSRKKKAF